MTFGKEGLLNHIVSSQKGQLSRVLGRGEGVYENWVVIR